MKQRTAQPVNGIRSQHGITLFELLTAMVILSLVCVLAIPYYSKWRKDIECREAAQNIVLLLREARSKAIAMNREHRVEFETLTQRYGLRGGDKAAKSNWSSVPPVNDWMTYSAELHVSVNVHSIQFNTNGTANGGTVTVSNSSILKKVNIIVNRTGRIRLQHSS